MKKRLFSIIFSLSVSFSVIAQHTSQERNPLIRFLLKRGYMFTDSISQRKNDSLQKWPKTLWPKTLYYNTIYVAKFLGSPTIPFSFNGIEYIKGSFQVDPVISIGFGYTLFTGDFIFNEIDKITVDQKLFFGIAAHIGLQENFDLSKLANIFRWCGAPRLGAEPERAAACSSEFVPDNHERTACRTNPAPGPERTYRRARSGKNPESGPRPPGLCPGACVQTRTWYRQ